LAKAKLAHLEGEVMKLRQETGIEDKSEELPF